MPTEKQEKETVSKEINHEKMNIHKKLLKVQSELKAPKGQYNSFGKYRYRSCEDVLEAAKPLLADNGLVLTLRDEIEEHTPRFYIKATATLIDVETGDTLTNVAYAREEDDKKGMDGSQVTGASSSYARKYALNGLFAIDDNKDSDTTNDGDDKKKSDAKSTQKDEKVDEVLIRALQEVKDTGTKIISSGVSKEKIQEIVGKHNGGKQNPSSIKTVEVCAAVMKDFTELLKQSPTPSTKTETEKTETKKETK